METKGYRAAQALHVYLARIGYAGQPRPDLATLTELNRLHLATFSYENIDIQLGRRVTRNPRAAYAKLVERGRGGWCYEYNGLFAWALEAVGFRVHHLAGAVMREAAGDKMIGNHLAPVVELGRLYLADPAMGILEPVPLAEGAIQQGWRRYSLEKTADGWWRFRNHPGALPPSFDFSLEIDDPAILEGACLWLQSDPDSPFVRHALVQRHFPDRTESLVGRMHSILSAAGERVVELSSREAYEKVARENMGLPTADLPALWAKIAAAPRTGFLSGMDEAA